jgi:hypothetical protein
MAQSQAKFEKLELFFSEYIQVTCNFKTLLNYESRIFC